MQSQGHSKKSHIAQEYCLLHVFYRISSPIFQNFQTPVNLEETGYKEISHIHVECEGKSRGVTCTLNFVQAPGHITSKPCLINPFPNKPWFSRVCRIGLLKTLWEKEKLLVASNFSFSHSVFSPFGELSAIFITFEIVVCKLFEFGKSLKFVVSERVTPI